MSEYVYYELPGIDTAATTNLPRRVPTSASTRPPVVLSYHCAAGNHDYDSDQCECPCHRGVRPWW